MSFSALLKNVDLSATPQTQPSPNAPTLQVRNNAGGFVFQITPEKQLDRFLILGTTGGTYYQTSKDLTRENVLSLKDLIHDRGAYVVQRVVEISTEGRARNNDYALFVLAMCMTHGDTFTKAHVNSVLPYVARTGTHIMHFVAFANDMRGWGSCLKKSVARWYNSKSPADLAFQAIKYQSRDKWSQRDLLRLSHPKPTSVEQELVYKYIVKGADEVDLNLLPTIVSAYESAKTADTIELIQLITDFRLSHEMIPTESRSHPAVWRALLPNMGATALIRNLNKMTAVGVIVPLSEASQFVCGRLRDEEWIKKARLHPLQLLTAMKIYASGQGDKGILRWNPDQNVVAALEDAFYISFKSTEPSGKRRFMAIDVSASMNAPLSGAPALTCREAAAVMAMVSLRSESNSVIYGFDHTFRDLGITRNDSLAMVIAKTYSTRFSATDCAVPMLHAIVDGLLVDQFEIYTDNETFYGRVHPFEALKAYRISSGIANAKLAVVSMTANEFSIANPTDENMIDLVGFDTHTPAVLSEFASGNL